MTSATGSQATVNYVLDGASDEALTSVVAADETERPGFAPLESLSAYLYDDLRALARAHPDALAEALHAPEDAAEDTNLFLKLACADLEQLVREQHVRAIALVAGGPDAAALSESEASELEASELEASARRGVRYRALYRVERPLDLADDAEDGALPPLIRRESRRSLAASLRDGAELALLLDWSPRAVKRGPILRQPPYAFLWVRTSPARFEDERLPAEQPRQEMTAASGVGGWYVAAVAAFPAP